MGVKRRKGFQSFSIYEELKSKIIFLELEPGSVIDEKKLMAELEVGRTPIRDAILRLKIDGLVVNSPNKSAYVKEITLKDVRDILEALSGVEKLVTTLAAHRMDSDSLKEIKKSEKLYESAVLSKDYKEIARRNRELHFRIAEACQNNYLISMNKNLRDQALRLACLAISREFTENQRLKNHHESIMDHHKIIISLLERGDSGQAAEKAVEHLKLFQDRIMFYINEMST